MAREDATERQATSLEHIPAAEHGKGFPPFEPETFASQLVWLVLIFGALYLLMSRVALPRIGAIIEARRERVEGDLAEASGLKDESDAAIAAYEKALADARGRAQALANETREQARRRGRGRPQGARRDAQRAASPRPRRRSRRAARRRWAMSTDIAVEAAAAIVERLIGTAPAAPDVAGAVADALKR